MYSRGSKNPFSSGFVATLLKALVGAGMVIMTLGLILFFNDIIASIPLSVYLQVAVDGLTIIMMSFIAIEVWRKLEFV